MNRTIRHGAIVAAVALGLGTVVTGCLTRPVEHSDPATDTNVQLSVPNQVIDKVDMLFDIDNSASMGDKQVFLSKAIPDLIARLVNPNCLDANGNVLTQSTQGMCMTGKAEFQAVHDMHLGIVTSSLGTRLPITAMDPSFNNRAVCANTTVGMNDPMGTTNDPYATVPTHNDDQAHLIGRALMLTQTPPAETSVGDAASGFLYWFPTTNSQPPASVTPVISANTLQMDFQSLVTGAGYFGCGIESQLESWYRFLIQPDPYASIVTGTPDQGGNATADWSGIDTTILKQRHDFLRPDSLVAVVVLSDENDSEIDVRSVGGRAYLFMDRTWTPPHGTAACDTNPGDPNCHNCGVNDTDPGCQAGSHTSFNDWGFDINLRHVHTKAKFGIDPQFPIYRYYLGLTSSTVVSRAGDYNHPDCVNPLFAAALPDGSDTSAAALCTGLTLGPRGNQKTLVFYAHIGGVPYQLLHFDPTSSANSALTDADWVRILGQGAASYTINKPIDQTFYDYNGIDPHMIEDYRDRTTVTYPFTTDPSLTNALVPALSTQTDAVNGREWTTDKPAGQPNLIATQGAINPHVFAVDRQYACTFPLDAPRDCTQPSQASACDCPSVATGLTPDEIPPVCNPQNPTQQIAAKAYPTTRELLLARLMGDQGIVSSICPQNTTDKTQLTYGYRPAVAVIIDKLKKALTNQCLPQKLAVAADGTVPCLILVTLQASAGGTCENPTCDSTQGLTVPDPDVLAKFCDQLEVKYVQNGGTKGDMGDPLLHQSVCQLQQLTPNDPQAATEFDSTGSCASSNMVKGWCYTTGQAANGCPQAIQFATGSPPSGSVTSLQCIEQSISVVSTTTK